MIEDYRQFRSVIICFCVVIVMELVWVTHATAGYELVKRANELRVRQSKFNTRIYGTQKVIEGLKRLYFDKMLKVGNGNSTDGELAYRYRDAVEQGDLEASAQYFHQLNLPTPAFQLLTFIALVNQLHDASEVWQRAFAWGEENKPGLEASLREADLRILGQSIINNAKRLGTGKRSAMYSLLDLKLGQFSIGSVGTELGSDIQVPSIVRSASDPSQYGEGSISIPRVAVLDLSELVFLAKDTKVDISNASLPLPFQDSAEKTELEMAVSRLLAYALYEGRTVYGALFPVGNIPERREVGLPIPFTNGRVSFAKVGDASQSPYHMSRTWARDGLQDLTTRYIKPLTKELADLELELLGLDGEKLEAAALDMLID